MDSIDALKFDLAAFCLDMGNYPAKEFNRRCLAFKSRAMALGMTVEDLEQMTKHVIEELWDVKNQVDDLNFE